MPRLPSALQRALASLLCALVMTACGDATGSGQAADTQPKVVGITIPGTPWHDSWKTFSARLDAQDVGIEPVMYLNGQLGSEESTLSQLRRGRIQLGGFSLQSVSTVVPELGVLLAPYLFESLAEADYVMDHYLTGAFSDLLAERNLVLLSWAEVGWTNVYAREPILQPADTRGQKLRSSHAQASQLFITSIGASMVPLPFPDVMPSLQTGLIDGGTSSAILYALAGVSAAAPHLTLTEHAFDTGMYLANRDWFQRLTPQQRAAVQSSLPTLDEFRATVRAQDRDLQAHPERFGITLHRLSPAQKKVWMEKSIPSHPQLIATLGGDAEIIYQRIQDAKISFRKQQEAAVTTETNSAADTAPPPPAPTASAQ